jgi:hypothetical protein
MMISLHSHKGVVRSCGMLATLAYVCSTLAACSAGTPGPVQFAALAVVDGKPTAVVITCGKPQIMVSLRTAVGADGSMSLWSVVVSVPDRVPSIDVELLGEPRRGWEVVPVPTSQGTDGRHPEVTPLTSIDDGRDYVLDASRPATEFQDAPLVTFTTDDLARIGSDQLLAATDHERMEVTSRESFLERTRCD